MARRLCLFLFFLQAKKKNPSSGKFGQVHTFFPLLREHCGSSRSPIFASQFCSRSKRVLLQRWPGSNMASSRPGAGGCETTLLLRRGRERERESRNNNWTCRHSFAATVDVQLSSQASRPPLLLSKKKKNSIPSPSNRPSTLPSPPSCSSPPRSPSPRSSAPAPPACWHMLSGGLTKETR